MKVMKLVGLLVVIAALGAGLVLVKRNQETRRGAYFATSQLSILPDEKKNITAGQEWTAKMMLTTNQKVDSVQLKIKIDKPEVIKAVEVTGNKDVFTMVNQEETDGGTIKLSALISKPKEQLPTGAIDLGTIKLKAVGGGTIKMTLDEYLVTADTTGVDNKLSISLASPVYEVAGATEKKIDLVFSPNSGAFKVGEKHQVKVVLKSGADPITAANLAVHFNKDRSRISNLKIESGFEANDSAVGDGIVDLTVLWLKSVETAPRGEVVVASFDIEGKAVGSERLWVDGTYEVVGNNGRFGLSSGEGQYVYSSVGIEPTSTVAPTLAITPTPKYFAMADYEFRPATGTIAVGDKTKVAMWLKSGTTKISGATLRVIYDKTKVKVSNLVASSDWNAPVATVNESTGEIKLAVISMKPSSQLPSGEIKIAEFEITGTTTGTAEFKLADDYEITGYNPSGDDNLMGLSSVGKGVFTIGSGASTGDSVLNFKIAFGKLAGDAKCVANWPIQVTVLGGGVSKIYPGVGVERDTSIADRVVFKGTLVLAGFRERNNVAVFIKGPKHLQMKYGVNGQQSAYGKAGGEISLTDSVDTSPWYDFSGFPLLPGDVSGEGGTQDGWVNGLDFSKVKQKSLTHEMVAEGEYLLEDLDGNCQMNANDVTVLKISLDEKQESLY